MEERTFASIRFREIFHRLRHLESLHGIRYTSNIRPVGPGTYVSLDGENRYIPLERQQHPPQSPATHISELLDRAIAITTRQTDEQQRATNYPDVKNGATGI